METERLIVASRVLGFNIPLKAGIDRGRTEILTCKKKGIDLLEISLKVQWYYLMLLTVQYK